MDRTFSHYHEKTWKRTVKTASVKMMRKMDVTTAEVVMRPTLSAVRSV
jgi:hypothetical protein